MTPTEAEMDILRILWEEGPSTVRLVNEKLNGIKPTGYTTTLKIMQIMFDKDLVKRNETNRSHIYTAKIGQDETQIRLMDRLLDSAFGGSASKLVMQALGSHAPSENELIKIKKLISDIEEGRQ